MSTVYWLEQKDSDVPPGDAWLSPGELARRNGRQLPQRRADWRLGRWTAKRALSLCLDAHIYFREIEILPSSSGAPEASIDGYPTGLAISISHRNGRAICAVAAAGTAVGCDLETVESHSAAFLEDYFTSKEQEAIAAVPADAQPLLIALLWSAKESVLKALHVGLRADTRMVNVVPGVIEYPGWGRWCGILETGPAYTGWWQQTDGLVRTVVTQPLSEPPICLTRQLQ